VFNDDFSGSGSNFGTGEIETMTNSSSNVHLDGNGNLDITALGSGNSWTSGRIQTTTANVGAPVGGQLEVTASIEQPNPSSGVGYWPAFWMLGPGSACFQAAFAWPTAVSAAAFLAGTDLAGLASYWIRPLAGTPRLSRAQQGGC
jgi:beta-glucanase (GH16 family)